MNEASRVGGVERQRPEEEGAAPERPVAAMILAAGRGERMRPLTDDTPKPLLLAGGRPLIEYHVVALARAGITRLVINLAWLGDRIRAALGDGSRFGVAINYSEERPKALETAGGIFRALPLLAPGPFAVVNGDVYCDFPLQTLRIAGDADAHLVLVPNPPQHAAGDFGVDGRFACAAPVAGISHTFSGIAMYRMPFFDGCVDGAFPLKPLLLRSIGARRCTAQLYGGHWEDVGTPARLAALDRELTLSRPG